jgi:hypothetical protein
MQSKGRSATGDRNGSRLYPDRLKRGDENHARLHPETHVHGDRCHFAKLSATQVLEIRHLHQAGNVTNRALAKRFGVSDVQISRIVRGMKWKLLT